MRWAMIVLLVTACSDSDPTPADLAVADLAFDNGNGEMDGSPCPQCPQMGPGQICVSGSLDDFESVRPLPGAFAARVGVYEPLALAADPNTAPLAVEDSKSAGPVKRCYTLTLPTPASGQIAVVVQSPINDDTLAPTVRTMPVEDGRVHRLDLFKLERTTAAAWQSALARDGGGFSGGTVVEYFAEPVPSPTDWRFRESHPAEGVTVTVDGKATEAVYLEDHDAPGTGTSTEQRGAAIVPALSGTLSGTGSCFGACSWEHASLFTVAGMWSTIRLHDCAVSTGAPSCN